jgi:endonuclease/exonuclease/phosphatase (EEP) superfamily protein YafD
MMEQPTIEPRAAAPNDIGAAKNRLSRIQRVLWALSWLSLAVVLLATAVLWVVSERTWWGTSLTFLPHHPFLAVPLLLLVVSLFAYRRMILVNLTTVLVAAFPLMGARIPFSYPTPQADDLCVVSCNVQRYAPDFDAVLAEIAKANPDVVALQEALWTDTRLAGAFPGWHTIQEDEFWIGSRYPLRRVGVCKSSPFERISGLSVEIEAPQGRFVLHDLHLTTARFGFTELSLGSIVDGTGTASVEKYTQQRRDEAIECRTDVDRHSANVPTVVVGDLNTPTVSKLYRDTWRGFANAFDEVGWGLGYTAPCTPHRYWFDDVPWVRIDHILVGDHWTVSASDIGSGNGSDHRLIWARLSRK